MAIDVFNEEVVSLSEATKRLPKVRNGKKLHLSTLFRWAQAGKIANDGMRVRLETIQVGGTKCTSLEAMQRFFDRLTGKVEVVTPPSITHREQRRRHERAMKELEEMGI
ncbi:hypothetical protein Q31b_16790 [Novipirellula aureliae]|uniref:DUF1580 domain-containing protein n=1 Tax=Novipirellula aureliae TaxID=2527966 RepID=A0A5C6E397_9BACT|nr:DUF1580 domain-containing protein [Novipirellula aureliae]TWU44143.1 hypothetical protein Q31b_16790 [Novipirellula aureliae]